MIMKNKTKQKTLSTHIYQRLKKNSLGFNLENAQHNEENTRITLHIRELLINNDSQPVLGKYTSRKMFCLE